MPDEDKTLSGSFVLDLRTWWSQAHTLHTQKSSKNICMEEKVLIRLMFNPGWALTVFRTILSCFQQINQTWARDPIEKPAPDQRST